MFRWLPSQTHVYRELAEHIESSTVSIEKAAGIIARDVGMSAKVVQLVSSGFFGTPQRILSAAHAARLLGLETLRVMLTSSSAFEPWSTVGQEEHLHLLTTHSLAVAKAATRIAETLTDDRALIGDAYLAGVLHEVGTLALAGPGKGELDFGGYLVALWGLPDPVVQAISYHRAPTRCPEQPSVPLTAVHVANALLDRSENASEEAIDPLDMAYLQANGCAECLDQWREEYSECQAEGVRQ